MIDDRQEPSLIMVLDVVKEVKAKIDICLEQNQRSSEDFKLLRKELGMDSPYGRFPLIEANITRLEMRVEGLEARLKVIEVSEALVAGQKKVMSVVWSFVSGSAGAALIAYILHAVGLFK